MAALEMALASTPDADLEAGSRKAMQRLVDARRTLTDPGGCHAYYTTLRASRWGQSDMWYTTEGVQILEEIKRKKGGRKTCATSARCNGEGGCK